MCVSDVGELQVVILTLSKYVDGNDEFGLHWLDRKDEYRDADRQTHIEFCLNVIFK